MRIVPRGGLFLTAGADVQRDRIEVEVVAWRRGKEAWSVDYRVLAGDTARADVWRQLDALLNEEFPHGGAVRLPIRGLCVDSGFNPRITYDWVQRASAGLLGPRRRAGGESESGRGGERNRADRQPDSGRLAGGLE